MMRAYLDIAFEFRSNPLNSMPFHLEFTSDARCFVARTDARRSLAMPMGRL
jgi:hypothetical protein